VKRPHHPNPDARCICDDDRHLATARQEALNLFDSAEVSLPELCIGVAPGRRGRGVGGVLLDELVLRCTGTLEALCSNVHVRNPAQKLYQRKGFRVVGHGRGPLGIAMPKDLR
jgi:GNAT superfamily N-acetyltransferase